MLLVSRTRARQKVLDNLYDGTTRLMRPTLFKCPSRKLRCPTEKSLKQDLKLGAKSRAKALTLYLDCVVLRSRTVS